MRPTRNLLPMALLILGAIGPDSARAGEGSGSIVGDLKLTSGPTVVYDYHFDHNAFADSVDLPGGLLALTRSGNLIRFDPGTRKPTREWFGPSRVTCLGRDGPDSALIGFEDGRIARLVPTTLDFTVIATLPGKPQWVESRTGDGKTSGGIVAVVERWKWFDVRLHGLGQVGFPGPASKSSRQQWMPFSEVHDLGSGKSCAIEGRASTVFLDSRRRAWFGFAYGEFGGWCRCVDLSGGQARLIRGPFDPVDAKDPYSDGVLGFAELRDGQIWTLGASSVTRVDGEKMENVIELVQEDFQIDLGPGKPDSAIERIVEDRANPGTLLAFSERPTIYRTDATLKRWDVVREIDIRSADASGVLGEPYLDLRAVHVRDGGLLCATTRDGYVFVAGKHESRDPAPDQLEAGSILRIEVSSGGTFFREWAGATPWTLRDGRWKQERLSFPGGGFLHEPRFFIGPAGAVFAIDATTTSRWNKGRAETVGDWIATDGLAPFETPDGSLWAVSVAGEGRESGRLMRLVGGKWAKVGDLPGAFETPRVRTEYLEGGEMLIQIAGEHRRTRRTGGGDFVRPLPPRGRYPVGEDVRIVNEAGPHWAILDLDEEQLLTLDVGEGLPSPRFGPLAVEEAGLPLKVYDALSWSPKEILIATRKDLKLCEIATGKHRKAPLPSPDRPVRRLARDGLGRLWLGGEGLWMVDPAGRLHDLAEVPMVGRSQVMALVADGQRKDGVNVSLGERGVAFLRAEVGP